MKFRKSTPFPEMQNSLLFQLFAENNLRCLSLAIAGIFFLSFISNAQPGTVASWDKISALQGNFQLPFNSFTRLGIGTACIGDIDNNGVSDLAVHSRQPGTGEGIVNILFMNTDGTVISYTQIGRNLGGLDGTFGSMTSFGFAIAGIGDINTDGVPDIVVGNNLGGAGGEIFTIMLNSNGTVNFFHRITEGLGFNGNLDSNDSFGCAVANIGDFNNDGVNDIAVGARGDDDGGSLARGAVWILPLTSQGTIAIGQQKISQTTGGFTGTLLTQCIFGSAITCLGDLNGDGANDIAVGAPGDTETGIGKGAVWILFLNANGTVQSEQKINDQNGGFSDTLDVNCFFGNSLSALGDINGDNIGDLAISGVGQDEGGESRGAIWITFLNSDGTVSTAQKISSIAGNFTAQISDNENFGSSISALGDFNGDNIYDIVVGVPANDDGFEEAGAIYLIYLNGDDVAGNASRPSPSFVVYPNPSENWISLRFTKEERNAANLIVTDIAGREIIKKHMPSLANQKLDVSELVPGTYQICILGKFGNYFQRLIIN